MAKLTEIMTREVRTVDPETSVAEAARSMVTSRVGSLIVMESGWLSGIFTERDVLRAAAAGGDLTAAPVSEWMTRDPQTVGPDIDSEGALEMMAAGGFRHLPVLDGNSVVGIVSLRDVLSARIAPPAR